MLTDPAILRQAMRFWTTGVTIVTASAEGRSHGMTVNSFTSVSLEPPQILISLAHNTRTHALVARSGKFGVTILSAGQQEISDRFAGRIADDQNRLAGLETFSLDGEIPLLKGGLAWLLCRVAQTIDSGSHSLFIAEVAAARSAESGAPLAYFHQGYAALNLQA
ncbi:MAG: flavin reductase family protein [Anaerolineales bacterium]